MSGEKRSSPGAGYKRDELLPAGMDVEPATQGPGRRSSAALIAAPCPLAACAASGVEGTNKQEARERCASVRVRRAGANVRSGVSRGRPAWKEPSSRQIRSTGGDARKKLRRRAEHYKGP
jgi:hypothetical protein